MNTENRLIYESYNATYNCAIDRPLAFFNISPEDFKIARDTVYTYKDLEENVETFNISTKELAQVPKDIQIAIDDGAVAICLSDPIPKMQLLQILVIVDNAYRNPRSEEELRALKVKKHIQPDTLDTFKDLLEAIAYTTFNCASDDLQHPVTYYNIDPNNFKKEFVGKHGSNSDFYTYKDLEEDFETFNISAEDLARIPKEIQIGVNKNITTICLPSRVGEVVINNILNIVVVALYTPRSEEELKTLRVKKHVQPDTLDTFKDLL